MLEFISKYPNIINSSPPRQWISSALIQIKACRLFDAKPLSKPMLGYRQLDPSEQTPVNCRVPVLNHSRQTPIQEVNTLKQKYRHFDEMFVTVTGASNATSDADFVKMAIFLSQCTCLCFVINSQRLVICGDFQVAPFVLPPSGGSRQLRGYISDLLEQLARRSSLTFDLHLVRDRQGEGDRRRGGHWTGMTGEILRRVRASAKAIYHFHLFIFNSFFFRPVFPF